MNTKRLGDLSVVLLFSLGLLAVGAGNTSIPFIGLAALPIALVGAFMIGMAASTFRGAQASKDRLILGNIVLLIGTIALLAGCISAVSDVNIHLLSAMRQEREEMRPRKAMMATITWMKYPPPDLRFLAGWRPAAETLALWLSGPFLLLCGVAFRQGGSMRERFLLLLYWLAGTPLSVLVHLFAYLGGMPLSA